MGSTLYNSTTYLVIDDHSLVRAGIRGILQKLTPLTETSILEAPSLQAAKTILCSGTQIDLILLDDQLPDSKDIQGLQTLRALDPTTRIVMLSSDDQLSNAISALQEGAVGFISKGFSEEVTMNALRLILSGETFVPIRAFTTAFPAAPIPIYQPCPSNFTNESIHISPRQKDILTLMLKGQSNKLIARELGIALGTVKNQVASILRILNATNRSQAIMNALKAGFDWEKKENKNTTNQKTEIQQNPINYKPNTHCTI